jgi:hypothetical protein
LDRKGLRVVAVVSGTAFPVVWVLLPMELKDPIFNWIDGSFGKVIQILLVLSVLLSGAVAVLQPGPESSGKWMAARVFFVHFNVAQCVVWLAFVLYIVFNPVVPH